MKNLWIYVLLIVFLAACGPEDGTDSQTNLDDSSPVVDETHYQTEVEMPGSMRGYSAAEISVHITGGDADYTQYSPSALGTADGDQVVFAKSGALTNLVYPDGDGIVLVAQGFTLAALDNADSLDFDNDLPQGADVTIYAGARLVGSTNPNARTILGKNSRVVAVSSEASKSKERVIAAGETFNGTWDIILFSGSEAAPVECSLFQGATQVPVVLTLESGVISGSLSTFAISGTVDDTGAATMEVNGLSSEVSGTFGTTTASGTWNVLGGTCSGEWAGTIQGQTETGTEVQTNTEMETDTDVITQPDVDGTWDIILFSGSEAAPVECSLFGSGVSQVPVVLTVENGGISGSLSTFAISGTVDETGEATMEVTGLSSEVSGTFGTTTASGTWNVLGGACSGEWTGTIQGQTETGTEVQTNTEMETDTDVITQPDVDRVVGDYNGDGYYDIKDIVYLYSYVSLLSGSTELNMDAIQARAINLYSEMSNDSLMVLPSVIDADFDDDFEVTTNDVIFYLANFQTYGMDDENNTFTKARAKELFSSFPNDAEFALTPGDEGVSKAKLFEPLTDVSLGDLIITVEGTDLPTDEDQYVMLKGVTCDEQDEQVALLLLLDTETFESTPETLYFGAELSCAFNGAAEISQLTFSFQLPEESVITLYQNTGDDLLMLAKTVADAKPEAPVETATETEVGPTDTDTDVAPTDTNTDVPPTDTNTDVPPTDTNTDVAPADTDTGVVVLDSITFEPVESLDLGGVRVEISGAAVLEPETLTAIFNGQTCEAFKFNEFASSEGIVVLDAHDSCLNESLTDVFNITFNEDLALGAEISVLINEGEEFVEVASGIISDGGTITDTETSTEPVETETFTEVETEVSLNSVSFETIDSIGLGGIKIEIDNVDLDAPAELTATFSGQACQAYKYNSFASTTSGKIVLDAHDSCLNETASDVNTLTFSTDLAIGAEIVILENLGSEFQEIRSVTIEGAIETSTDTGVMTATDTDESTATATETDTGTASEPNVIEFTLIESLSLGGVKMEISNLTLDTPAALTATFNGQACQAFKYNNFASITSGKIVLDAHDSCLNETATNLNTLTFSEDLQAGTTVTILENTGSEFVQLREVTKN